MRSPLLDAKDVALRLNVSVRTAQRLMRTVPNINVCLGDTYERLRITEETLEANWPERDGRLPPQSSRKAIRNVSDRKTTHDGKIARRPLK